MSPNLSGIKWADHARCVKLVKKALEIIDLAPLKERGSIVCKIFQGNELKGLVDELALRFRSVRLYKPDASRNESSETFLVAKGFSGKHPSL